MGVDLNLVLHYTKMYLKLREVVDRINLAQVRDKCRPKKYIYFTLFSQVSL